MQVRNSMTFFFNLAHLNVALHRAKLCVSVELSLPALRCAELVEVSLPK